ncbi:protein cramped-like isoform X2 [Macrosteles quadrilineatus]|uniref:protein cramped-like isoform X2 n=1 Tax=Macrosteles quadrilineatus TaxID=74068 RepID=UPI0023E1C0DF|nr:protein cramped-like isoform X2 [Macrosteles quadrilineatus]
METEGKPQDNALTSSISAVTNGSEVLGSVTDSEGGIQLRTSARVSKKLKLDSLAQASEKKDQNHEEEKKVEVPPVVESKPRSKRVDWSAEDKCAFFEALNEFGKDIDAIHNYLVQKSKRRGGQETKTKDQVRFFYYRMWSILSKHITFPPHIKKQTQELYALINFGELRKKISFSIKKHYEKLSEMIYSGSTQLKFRGKVRKVRTPLCKALRKLNQIQESSEELRLPSCVTVELRPRYNEDWCRVQALAQNPRVRSLLPLHRRLETLLSYLTKRWQTPDSRLRQQLEGETQTDSEGQLRVGPRPGTYISPPSVRLSEVATSSKLSLLAYEQRFHPTCKEVAQLLQQLPVIHRTKGRGVKRPRADSVSAKEVEETEAAPGGDSQEIEPTPPALALDCVSDNAQPDIISPRANGEMMNSPLPESAPTSVDLPQTSVGWSLATCGTTRIGDLYIMFGCDAKIHLDYWWESPQESSVSCTAESSLTTTLRKLLSVAKLETSKNKNSTSNNNGCDSQTSKSRLSKPKAQQDGVQKVEAQLKFKVCPLTLDDVFLRPTILKTTDGAGDRVEKMRPRYCNRRGRPRRPPAVPPRLAPLLPKVSLFNSVTRPQGFKPIAPAPTPVTAATATATPVSIDVKVAPVALVTATSVTPTVVVKNVVSETQPPSPPSLSNLLDDLSLPSLSAGSSRLSTPVPSFRGLLDSQDGSEVSKDQWITSDPDLSLSGFSFLNNLDTDIKDLGNESRLSDMVLSQPMFEFQPLIS